MHVYRSLEEHLTSLPKKGVGPLLSGSAFNHERAYLQWLDDLKANNWTMYNGITSGFELESWWHTTLSMAPYLRSRVVWFTIYTTLYYASYNIYYSAWVDYVSTVSPKTYTCGQEHIKCHQRWGYKCASLLPNVTQLQSVWVSLWTLKTIFCTASISRTR